jgi:curved DNA-binding protein CbpA
MKTLYDVLGVRPNDDGAECKRAFRVAVKTCHPDIHADNPDASVRFRQVVEAYEVLRDPETRAAYDGLLELERARETARCFAVRKFIFNGIAAAGLTVVMAAGCVVLRDVSSSGKLAQVAAATWAGPVDAMQQAAPTDTTDRDAWRSNLADASIHGGPARSSAARPDGLNIAGASMIDGLAAPARQAYARAADDQLNNNSAIGPLDPEQQRSAAVPSSAERDNIVPKSRLPGSAKSHEKHGVQPRDRKPPARRAMMKWPVFYHTPRRRVLLQRNSSRLLHRAFVVRD